MSQNSEMTGYRVLDAGEGAFVKSWTRGVPVEAAAEEQLRRTARMPFVWKWVAAMPDVHLGKGATIGSVIPTDGAIIPAAVGVDLGCGMMAARTTLRASDLPDDLHAVRVAIEAAVPHGRTGNGRPELDRGAWGTPPAPVVEGWASLAERYRVIVGKHPKIGRGVDCAHLGTLGTGNHFIEVCLDEAQAVWVMLHSGSRGVGNRDRQLLHRDGQGGDEPLVHQHLPDADLAYLVDGTEHFEGLRPRRWAGRRTSRRSTGSS